MEFAKWCHFSMIPRGAIIIISTRVNDKIRVPLVRVIDADGSNLGVISTDEALRIATQKGLDLVEVSANANPPVCKIQDYKKYLYEQNSKLRKTRTKKSELKEFVFGPHIGEGDLKIRIERGRKFILDGNVVKYTIQFKGRQIMYPEIGETKLKIIESELADVARPENPVKLLHKDMTVTFVAKKSN